MAVPSRIRDHYEAAVSRLISQFRSPKPVLHGMLGSFVEQIQILEDATWDVIHGRLLDAAPGEASGAIGAQLDVLGKVIGLSRGGLSDSAYRAALKLRIRVNRSRGTSPDLLEILRLAMPLPAVFAFTEENTLATRTRVAGITLELAFTLLTSLNAARAAGYRAILEYHTDRVSTSATFKWANSGTGGQGGFGNFGDSASGGKLYSVQG